MNAAGLDRLLSGGRKTTGIVCVHCQGKRFAPQHYDERTGWSDEHVPCATCQGTGRIYTVEQYLKTLPADWHQDSSLETWFPLLAEEIKRLESERNALRAENERLTPDGEREDCQECSDLRSAPHLADHATKQE